MISKKIISRTAAALITYPALPKWKGPLGTFFRPVKRCGAIARAYDTEVRMMNEPAKSVNATLLPNGMAPSPIEMTTQKSAAGIGQLSVSLTVENNSWKGVALSRARAHL